MEPWLLWNSLCGTGQLTKICLPLSPKCSLEHLKAHSGCRAGMMVVRTEGKNEKVRWIQGIQRDGSGNEEVGVAFVSL